jgi:hypothetical protein
MNSSNKDKWINDYELWIIRECPYCNGDNLEHSCRNCYSEINKDTCWKYEGYCHKCYIYIKEEIPRIDQLKKELGVICSCDNPSCSKCLLGNCKDDNCPVHTMELKIARKKV